MKHIEIWITAEQRSNLERLADYLSALPDTCGKFDMATYCEGAVNAYDAVEAAEALAASCDTVACAAGHGPSAGVAAEDGEAWDTYVGRAFGADDREDKLYIWIFAPEWEVIDNTANGAAARIRYFLEHGLPENYHQQWQGEAPLCYED